MEGICLEEVTKAIECYSGVDRGFAGPHALRRDAEKVTKEDFGEAFQTIKRA